jgi:hypothetical protein
VIFSEHFNTANPKKDNAHMPTTQKLMNMQISDLNPNLPKILGSYGRGMMTPTNAPQRGMDLQNPGTQTEAKAAPAPARGFSQFGKSLLEVKQGFFKSNNNQTLNHETTNPTAALKPGPQKINSSYNIKNTMSTQKNESDHNINYRPRVGQNQHQPNGNTYGFNLGGIKDYGYNNGSNLPQLMGDPKGYPDDGRKRNDSLGALENRIKNTEMELNQVREKLEKTNANPYMQRGAASYYGDHSRVGSFAPSYRTSQPWATHEGITDVGGGRGRKGISYGNTYGGDMISGAYSYQNAYNR